MDVLKEVQDVEMALNLWLQSQNIHTDDGCPAMIRLCAAMMALMAPSTAKLNDGLTLAHNLLEVAARECYRNKAK